MNKEYKIKKIYDIYLELTNICNFNCKFCPYGQMKRKKGIMEKNFAFDIIEQIKEYDISKRIALFLMGEPFLVKYIFEVIEKIHQSGLQGIIHTNASLFNDDLIEKILDSDLYELDISLQTFGSKAFYEKTDEKYDYKEYMKNILRFIKRHYEKKSKINVKIHFFASSIYQYFIGAELKKFIKGDFKEVYLFFENWIRNNVIDDRMQIKDFELSKYKEYDILLLPNIHLVSRKVTTFGGNIGNKKKYKAVFGSCNALVNQIGILWNGIVVPCCNDYDGKIVLGDLHKDKLIDIINSEIAIKLYDGFKKGIVWHPVCKQCRGGSNIWYWLFKQSASFIGRYKNIGLKKDKF